MIRDRLIAEKPIRPVDIGNVEREIKSRYYTATQREILEELREIRRRRVMHLDLGSWEYRFLYSEDLDY
eukprot:6033117-Pyramimonas_sp.AAC.1